MIIMKNNVDENVVGFGSEVGVVVVVVDAAVTTTK